MPLAPELESALVVWQCLVALKFFVDLVNRIAELVCIHLGVDVSHGLGAVHWSVEPMLPEAGFTTHFQSVQASYSHPKHRGCGFGHNGGGYARFQSPVGKAGDKFR